MLLEILLILVGLFIIWWLATSNADLKKYGNLIPGPKSHTIFGNLLNVPLHGTEAFKTVGKLWNEHGPVIRLWLGSKLLVMIFDAEDLEVLLKSTTHLEKGEIYGFVHPWIGTGLLTSKGSKWKARRKGILPTFHPQVLEDFLEIFGRHADLFVERLSSKVGEGYFDVKPYALNYTLDVICETAMGINISVQTLKTNEYRAAVEKMSELIGKRFNTPLLYNNLAYYLSGLKSKENTFLKVLKEHTRQVVDIKSEELLKREQHKNDDFTESGIKRKKALLENLLCLKRDSDPVFQNESDICEEVDTFMFAGHESTAVLISFALDMLAANPQYQEKLYDEVSASFSKDACNPAMEQLNNLKYLDMFMKEVERFAPSVPLIARQLTEHLKLKSGYIIPAGTMLCMNIFQIHRNERWFKNPSAFNPDNFLPEETAKRHPYAYIPFSAGPRNCIGQKFAMLEGKTALVKLILNYKFEVEPDFEIIFNSLIVLDSATGHRLKVLRRE